MSRPALAIEALSRPPAGLPGWARTRWARAARATLQRVFLFPLVRLLCRELSVAGRARLPRGPVVLAANHASHADTAVLLRALPRRLRARTAPAAAEDYFFKGALRRAIVPLLTGAFPFPRRGSAGLERAEALLASGHSVLLFPEGTRSTDGAIHEFRSGVGLLAARGWTVVPVGIAGTAEVLPKGRSMPRRAPVAIEFGDPVRVPPGAEPVRVARMVEARVRRLAARAALGRAHPSPTLHARGRDTVHARVRRFATSRRALVLAFAWGIAEALFFPVIPDFLVALLAAAAPSAFLSLALAATAGSVLGGAAAWALGAAGLVPPLLLTTPRMHEAAAGWMVSGGAGALWRQPWSGIPFKVFGYGAASAGVGVLPFLAVGASARGLRMIEVGAAFALVGWIFRRRASRLFGAFAVLYSVVFAFGLAHVAGQWS